MERDEGSILGLFVVTEIDHVAHQGLVVKHAAQCLGLPFIHIRDKAINSRCHFG